MLIHVNRCQRIEKVVKEINREYLMTQKERSWGRKETTNHTRNIDLAQMISEKIGFSQLN